MRGERKKEKKKETTAAKTESEKRHEIYDIFDIYFVNCNWVAPRWQQFSTHLHTNSTQNNTINYNSTTSHGPPVLRLNLSVKHCLRL